MSVQYYKRFQIVVGIVLKISRTIVCYDPPLKKKKKVGISPAILIKFPVKNSITLLKYLYLLYNTFFIVFFFFENQVPTLVYVL